MVRNITTAVNVELQEVFIAFNTSDYLPAENSTSQYTYGARVFVSMAILLISVLGVTGNAIVLMAVALSCRLQTITNVFVANLSVADLLLCLCASVNAVIVLIRGGLPQSLENLCFVVAFTTPSVAGVTLFSIAAIAVNRMLLITKHTTVYKKMYQVRKLVPTLVIIWLLPFIIVTVLLVSGVGQLSYNNHVNMCLDDSGHHLSILYKTLLAATLYPGPVAITLISYGIVYTFIRRHLKKGWRACSSFRYVSSTAASSHDPSISEPVVSVITDTTRKKRIKKHQIQITKNLFVVSCVCFLLPLPNCLFIMLGADNLFLYGVIFLFANSAVNPLLYGAKHPMFKEVMLCILHRQWSDIPEPSRLLKALLSRFK